MLSLLLAAGTFALAGSDAARSLLTDYYDGAGGWRACNAVTCPSSNADWGADAATGTLYLRWSATQDPQLSAVADRLIDTSARYPKPCTAGACRYWSDTPAWDAVASMREFEMTGDARALERARAAYRFVERSTSFSAGACPSIPYQQAPSPAGVKTLETLANEIKAGLLLYRVDRDPRELAAARAQYASARAYFLDAATPLYTVHVIDDGTACTPVQSRYFASVNGLMIWDGIELASDLHDERYVQEAVATARAVDAQLSDGAGIFADAAGENDVVEPLVEAMLRLAAAHPFAAAWIGRNAQAALGSRAADGSFARYFDGPPQQRSSIWESNGGFAIEIAAAAIAPNRSVQRPQWSGDAIAISPASELPARIEVDGAAVALVGSVPAACEQHHVHVYVDGVEINDHAGLWINPTMPEDDPVLFAWRFDRPGEHTIELVTFNRRRSASHRAEAYRSVSR